MGSTLCLSSIHFPSENPVPKVAENSQRPKPGKASSVTPQSIRARNPERKGAIAEADSKAHVTRKEEQQDEGGILCSSSKGFLNCKRLALGQRKALQVEGAACTRAWSWIVHALEVTGQLRTIS